MKKVTFYKAMYDGKGKPPRFQKSTGYRSFYTVTGTDIEISLVFEKRAHDWAITEESSGMLVLSNFNTRKEAEVAVNPNILRAIADRLHSVNELRTMLNIYRGRVEDCEQCGA